ncbi:hypothetical protein [Streptomyces tubercidicus]|uniref:Uncharacterized protein n=1 Tax=Streptomyces tubercidicus TaxID=47759 RepID=A0A640UYJ2_9ACTN|nr:hypothetical protein [Streptomyces tubercidicus]WAU15328.1 hypothetical protein STRTU_006028 [Streptomyces tubercidicus]GFE41163.1 hypothetical protein Stube_58360 [Streptomyces tubercidicus]
MRHPVSTATGLLFQADAEAFRHAPVRLLAVRSPWLREMLDNLTQHMRAGLF